jgi:dTDP-4-dehydrorhamnose reductase
MKRLIILGAKGYVGHDLERYAQQVGIPVAVDLGRFWSFEDVLSSLREYEVGPGDVVVNMVKTGNPYSLQQLKPSSREYLEVWLVNVLVPEWTALACRMHGATFVQFSTFMHLGDQVYEETRSPESVGLAYSLMKWCAEDRLQWLTVRGEWVPRIVRIHQPLSAGEHKGNLLTKIWSMVDQGSLLLGEPSSVSVLGTLWPSFIEWLERPLEPDTGRPEILHLVNPGLVSPARIGELLQEVDPTLRGKEVRACSLDELTRLVEERARQAGEMPVYHRVHRNSGASLSGVRSAEEAVAQLVHELFPVRL